jgi:hypothetical protein
MIIASARRQATDFEQLKPEGPDLCEHALQRRLVPQRSRQDGILAADLSPEGGKRGPQRLAQVAPYADLVLRRLRSTVCAGHAVTSHETGQQPMVAPWPRTSRLNSFQALLRA